MLLCRPASHRFIVSGFIFCWDYNIIAWPAAMPPRSGVIQSEAELEAAATVETDAELTAARSAAHGGQGEIHSMTFALSLIC